LWWTWMNDCDWMTHLMTLWPKKKEPRFEFISAMAENLVWQLVVSAYVRYIYIYIEFMWRWQCHNNTFHISLIKLLSHTPVITLFTLT
jgi:hypothetical protein